MARYRTGRVDFWIHVGRRLAHHPKHVRHGQIPPQWAAGTTLGGSAMTAHLLGILERPAIDTIVRCVQPTLWEPLDVAVYEGARAYGVEGAIPDENLACFLRAIC